MNLTINTLSGSLTIGATTFTEVPVDLVDISCLNDELCWNAIFDNVKDGSLKVQLNGEDLPQLSTITERYSALSYVSRLIQKQINGAIFVDFPKLEEDWNNKI
ncbi:MAG: hypothetical protein S4CHLAM20_04250 [Chlamydiia bacterium]|nr:hypothetical protein [Chlamydiia bacterium]